MKIKNWIITITISTILVFVIPFFIILTLKDSSATESAFFDVDWHFFYGTKDSKNWISHPTVDKVAKKTFTAQTSIIYKK